jgi:hypothetical protein
MSTGVAPCRFESIAHGLRRRGRRKFINDDFHAAGAARSL